MKEGRGRTYTGDEIRWMWASMRKYAALAGLAEVRNAKSRGEEEGDLAEVVRVEEGHLGEAERVLKDIAGWRYHFGGVINTVRKVWWRCTR